MRKLSALVAADGSLPDADGLPSLDATALTVLALLGSGSTLRSGPHRELLKRGTIALRELSENPRAGLRGSGLAALAFAEAQLLSNYPPLRQDLQRCLESLETKGREGQPAMAAAWAALALHDSADARSFDEAAITAMLTSLVARETDPVSADLGRLTLALALPKQFASGRALLATARRLSPRNQEEQFLALSALSQRAHDRDWRDALERVVTRGGRLARTQALTAEELALDLLVARVTQLASRLIRPDLSLVVRVLEIDGNPAEGHLVAAVSGNSPVQPLVEGRATFQPAPPRGARLRWFPPESVDSIGPPAPIELGSIAESAPRDGTELTVRIRQ